MKDIEISKNEQVLYSTSANYIIIAGVVFMTPFMLLMAMMLYSSILDALKGNYVIFIVFSILASLLVFVYSRQILHLSDKMVITDKGIHWVVKRKARYLSFKDIKICNFEEEKVGKSIRLYLKITMKKGESIEIDIGGMNHDLEELSNAMNSAYKMSAKRGRGTVKEESNKKIDSLSAEVTDSGEESLSNENEEQKLVDSEEFIATRKKRNILIVVIIILIILYSIIF